jgi:pyridoxal phosphate enzyme (YggS family)
MDGDGDARVDGEPAFGPGSAERSPVRESLSLVRSGIAAACARSGRAVDDVTLIAVTKTVVVEVIRQALEAGVEHFAENYANQLAAKSSQIAGTWHFIGKLQRGTAARIADHARVIHSAEPGQALERVAARAARRGDRIACLVQVDFTGARQGIRPEDVAGFVEQADASPGIEVTGLMTLPPWMEDPEATRPYFARLRELRDTVGKDHPNVRELSMGMSGDYQVAVEEGATMVRIGTALFGPRPTRETP